MRFPLHYTCKVFWGTSGFIINSTCIRNFVTLVFIAKSSLMKRHQAYLTSSSKSICYDCKIFRVRRSSSLTLTLSIALHMHHSRLPRRGRRWGWGWGSDRQVTNDVVIMQNARQKKCISLPHPCHANQSRSCKQLVTGPTGQSRNTG